MKEKIRGFCSITIVDACDVWSRLWKGVVERNLLKLNVWKTIKKIVIASVSHAMSSHATIWAIENQHHHGAIHQLDFFGVFIKEKTLDMMVMLADEKWEAK